MKTANDYTAQNTRALEQAQTIVKTIGAFQGMINSKWFTMTKEAREQLKADPLCDFTATRWKVTSVHNDGTIDIEGNDGAIFPRIDVGVLNIKT